MTGGQKVPATSTDFSTRLVPEAAYDRDAGVCWDLSDSDVIQSLMGNTQAQCDLVATPAEEELPPSIADRTAAWANHAFETQDERFFDSATNGLWDALKSMKDGVLGYAKCNQFVAAAFTEGAGVDYPSVDGRPPLVEELADPEAFQDQLSYETDVDEANSGDMVLWHDEESGVHHSAILSGYNEAGEPMVTYAGAGEEIKQITLTEATEKLQDVSPVFRSWQGDQERDVDQCSP